MNGIELAERGWLPDALIRHGIRRLQRDRLRQEDAGSPEARLAAKQAFIDMMKGSPLAVHTEEANSQHYELPAAFFELVLGPHLKYSACLFEQGDESLADAEAAMLSLTCERADLADGQDILELGCGWGSLTLWMAERYPAASITAVSNSAFQRAFIEARCRERGFHNVNVLTVDINRFDAEGRFDRVVSVEMFEHLRNYEIALARVSGWLRPEGSLFLHIFCHRAFPYLFTPDGESSWMGRYFFTGGLMPSDDLLYHFHRDMRVSDHWVVDGRHYRETAERWLANLDRNRAAVRDVLSRHYGDALADRWLQRWRIFFMACAELWGFGGGREWWVSHYRLQPQHSEVTA